MEKKYLDIYNKMEEGKYYTAKDLGCAPASMTAMYNRDLVERTDSSPRQYRKINSKGITIQEIWEKEGSPDFFSIYSDTNTRGFVAQLKNGKLVDGFDRALNARDFHVLEFCRKGVANHYDLDTGKIMEGHMPYVDR